MSATATIGPGSTAAGSLTSIGPSTVAVIRPLTLVFPWNPVWIEPAIGIGRQPTTEVARRPRARASGLLAQKLLATELDWRVSVLAGEPPSNR